MSNIIKNNIGQCTDNICKQQTVNCFCSPCTPNNITPGNLSTAYITPILGKRLLQCVSIRKDDVGVNNEYQFTLNTSNEAYTIGEKVVITKSYLTYDYIGLPQSLVNSSEVYIDGEIFNLTPRNLYNAGTIDSPEYLFSELSGYVSLKNHCCRNDTEIIENRKVKIVESAKYFEVSNLVINIEGYIGCDFFSASASISDSDNENNNFIRLTSLGVLSSVTFAAYVCWPNIEQNILLDENFEFNLCVDCVIPTQDYGVITTGLTEDGVILANVDFNFSVTKNINLISKEKLPVLATINSNSNGSCANDLIEKNTYSKNYNTDDSKNTK